MVLVFLKVLSEKSTILHCQFAMRGPISAYVLLLYAGGFFHGVRSLTFGVNITEIRLMGILQVCTIQIYVVMKKFLIPFRICLTSFGH